jgi:hypothetical protein
MSEPLSDREMASKIQLCILPTQQGKTFTAISRIEKEIEQDEEHGRSIHIVFTMNTLLNSSQFATRLSCLDDEHGKGSVVVFSCKNTTNFTHVSNLDVLKGKCFDEMTCPRVVVMCSNKARFTDGVEFLHVINRNCGRTIMTRAFVYYDELHNYISDKVRQQIREIHELDCVHGIIGLTATPDCIWKETGFWSRLNLIKLENYNHNNYVGAGDMIYNEIQFFAPGYVPPAYRNFDSSNNDTIRFIEHILNKHPEILAENTRTFIPAHVRCDGHEIVREIVFDRSPNAVVCVINGKDKSLQYIADGNKRTLHLVEKSSIEEVSETLSRLIIEHNLQRRPLVVTGFLCVGMGQTLTHKNLGSFTSAIFSHLNLTNDESYQLFGRITGRMKDWDTYVPTQVYCPPEFMKRCIAMESCARNMAEISHEAPTPVTKSDYRKPIDESEDSALVLDNMTRKKAKPTPRARKVDPRQTVPVVINLSREMLEMFAKIPSRGSDNKKRRHHFVLERILEYSNDLHEQLSSYDCDQITTPKEDNSYKKHISDLVNASINNKPFDIDVKGKRENDDRCNRNFFNCYVDERELRFVIMIWNGRNQI